MSKIRWLRLYVADEIRGNLDKLNKHIADKLFLFKYGDRFISLEEFRSLDSFSRNIAEIKLNPYLRNDVRIERRDKFYIVVEDEVEELKPEDIIWLSELGITVEEYGLIADWLNYTYDFNFGRRVIINVRFGCIRVKPNINEEIKFIPNENEILHIFSEEIAEHNVYLSVPLGMENPVKRRAEDIITRLNLTEKIVIEGIFYSQRSKHSHEIDKRFPLLIEGTLHTEKNRKLRFNIMTGLKHNDEVIFSPYNDRSHLYDYKPLVMLLRERYGDSIEDRYWAYIAVMRIRNMEKLNTIVRGFLDLYYKTRLIPINTKGCINSIEVIGKVERTLNRNLIPILPSFNSSTFLSHLMTNLYDKAVKMGYKKTANYIEMFYGENINKKSIIGNRDKLKV